MSTTFEFFVGIDLGSQSHHVWVCDRDGRPTGDCILQHNGSALGEFPQWLAQHAPGAPQQVAVALETPHGALVDVLMERAYAVFSINPKQLDRFRDRFSVAGAKDDRRDARVLAESLRTDLAHFRPLQPEDPQIVRLRELSRAEDAVAEDFRRSANQLWNYLQRFFPALLQLCGAADEAWLWELLERCQGLPERAARLSHKQIASLLNRHHIRRISPDQVRQLLQHPVVLAPGKATAIAEQVLLLLPRLRLLHQQRSMLVRRTEQLLAALAAASEHPEHRSVQILQSIAGVGRVFTATVLAEARRPLDSRDYHALRALAGVAPVTSQSGKTRLVTMRRACNGRLREACFHAANVHMQKDPQARRLYVGMRSRGCSHGRALRGVADRLLHLLCVLLRQNTLYDPARRMVSDPAAA